MPRKTIRKGRGNKSVNVLALFIANAQSHRHIMKLIASVGLCLSQPVFAIVIGDYVSATATRGQIEISQLDNTNYLEVIVEVSGQPVDFQVNQVADDRVQVEIDDNLLESEEAFIRISVQSAYGSASRIISHNQKNVVRPPLKQKEQVDAAFLSEKSLPRTKVFVPAKSFTGQSTPDESASVVNGQLQIDIDGGINTVGYAVNQLAKVNNLTVVVLLGDEIVHQAPLVSDVTQFNDLYAASNQLVRHVFIDDMKGVVRIVGHDKDIDGAAPFGLEVNTSHPLKVHLNNVAQSMGYEILTLFGDEVFLNTLINNTDINTLEDLALLVGELGGTVNIDDNRKLIRLSK